MALPVPRPTAGLIQKQTLLGYSRDLWVPNSFDYDVFEDKFWGDALLTQYPVAKTNGASAAVTFTEHNANGFLELVSGTDNAGYAGQGMGLQFTGDRGLLAEFIVRTPSVVTTMKMEVGLADADDAAGMVDAKATPTATGTDYGVFVVDTTDDTTIAFHSAIGGVITATESSGLAIAASTTYRFAIRIEGDNLEAWVNETRIASHSASIQGGTALTPWVFVQARAGSASRTIQLHKWRITQPAY